MCVCVCITVRSPWCSGRSGSGSEYISSHLPLEYHPTSSTAEETRRVEERRVEERRGEERRKCGKKREG
jgi:hypothetical protein